jgi:chemotaxis protein histidine kinase CheA
MLLKVLCIIVAVAAFFWMAFKSVDWFLANHVVSYSSFAKPGEPNWKERKAYWLDKFAQQDQKTEWVKFVEGGLRSDRDEYAKALDLAYSGLIAEVELKRQAALDAKGIEVTGQVFQVVKKDALLVETTGIPIGREDYYGYMGGIVLIEGIGPGVVDGSRWSGYVKLVGTRTCKMTDLIKFIAGPSKVLVFVPVSPSELKRCDREAGFLSERLTAIHAAQKKEVAIAWQTGDEIDAELKAGEIDAKERAEKKAAKEAADKAKAEAERVFAEAKAKELARLAKEAKDKVDALADFQAKERAEEYAAIKAKADAETAAEIAAKAKEAADRAKEEAEAAMLIDDLKAKDLPPEPVQDVPKTKPVKGVFAPKDWLTGTWQYKDGSRIWYRDYANGKFRVRVGRRVEWVGVYSILSPTEAISEGAGSKQGITLRQDGTLNIAGKYRASRVADYLTGR